MTNPLETIDTPESIEEKLNGCFETIKQTLEDSYQDPIILDGKNDSVQKWVRHVLTEVDEKEEIKDPFIVDFPRKLNINDIDGLTTLTIETRQNLTKRINAKVNQLNDAGENVSIKDIGFQRYKDIDAQLEKIINISSGREEASQ
jgi:hypothetical protein